MSLSNRDAYTQINVHILPGSVEPVMENVGMTEFMMLKESDDIMFSGIDKIVATGGMYYIMDTYGSRSVISFDGTGNAYASYGRIGQGPGEYSSPQDIDVDGDSVYVLDSNQKKVIKYLKSGEFVVKRKFHFLQ